MGRMIYGWRCLECGHDQDREISEQCESCAGRTTRVYGLRFNRRSANTEEVFNPSLGIHHRTDTQAQEHIKKTNDLEGTHYVLADPDDTRMI